MTADLRAAAARVVAEWPVILEVGEFCPHGAAVADAYLALTDPAPVTAAALRAWPGWEDDRYVACSCRPVSAGLVVRVWLNTGGVEVYGPGYEIGVRLVESGCTLGRLRQLVNALDPGAK